jgi:hypothetical protein
MRSDHRLATMVLLAGFLLINTLVGFAAEGSTEALRSLKASAQSAKEFAEALPAEVRGGLSSSVQNIIGLADRWDRIESLLQDLPADHEPAGARLSARDFKASEGLFQGAAIATKPVSNPAKDFVRSRLPLPGAEETWWSVSMMAAVFWIPTM